VPTESGLQRWQRELAAWEIPAEILAEAPEPPWGFPVEMFRAAPDSPDTPSRDHALEALPEGGSVLDVGCGGGAAAMALVPPAGLLTGVDESADMLTAFAAAAHARKALHRSVQGTWPAVVDEVEPADVVVCHHVLYNVADLEPFVAALTAKARHRVVAEITALHPMSTSAALWQHFHGIQRRGGPSADVALAALRELGVAVEMQRWTRPPRDIPRSTYVELNRRRLCLPAEADAEIDRLLPPTDRPRDVATLWWQP
jgi:SAM-dependent methyltransferase